MSYSPTNWSSGDIITTAKLNKIELGIVEAASSGGGVFIVNVGYDENVGGMVCDKTAGEIEEAYLAGLSVIFKMPPEGSAIVPISDGGESNPR